MNRITICFEKLEAKKKTALIPFITAGDPHPDSTVAIMHALVDAGADIIELGVPFSDPMADGPSIQLASQRALVHNMGLNDVLATVREFRSTDNTTPVVLMGYLNPVETMGYQRFTEDAAEAGVDGVLLVDLPPEEAVNFRDMLSRKDIKLIFLIAPNTSEQRVKKICAVASGYLYYVSIKGVTGKSGIDTKSVAEGISRVKSSTSLPVGVGFGIRDPETAAEIGSISDAVIVGSVLVEAIAKNQGDLQKICQETAALIQAMRRQIDIVTGCA